MIKFYVFLIFSCSIFFYGITVGHYEIFPFDFIQSSKSLILNNFEKDQNNILIYENDIDSLIKINSENDIIDKRKNLTNFIWKNTIPYSSLILIDKNIEDLRYSNFINLKSIDKLNIEMEYEINSIAYLFLPENSNNELIIYHQGHAGDFIEGKDSIEFFINEGYSVLAMSMPLLGMNNNPIIDLDNFGKIKFTNHKQLRFLESSTFSPIKFFVEPIGVSLNYLENFNFNAYHMMGISGGGWTTILFSALDDRISQSYSVAGSFPMFMRSDSKNIGDYEQIIPELYSIANYLELYIMGSYGSERKLVLIYNEFDPCCFPGELYEKYPYLEVISQKLNLLDDGEFDVIIDKSSNKHEISNMILNQILDELDS
mgnify:CR=1 FL=1|jgi:hypothetical protein